MKEMLRGSCTVADKLHTLAQCRVRRPSPDLHRRPNAVVSCSSAPRRDLSASLSSLQNQANGVSSVEKPDSLADRLRLGSLTDHGLAYTERFIVRSYEVGINKTVTIETIANLMQEVGCNQAQNLGFSTDGFGTTPTMRKHRLIWVTARMHIEMYKYPAWSDVVEIETWYQAEGRIGTRRDFIIRDYATRQVLGRATRLHMGDDEPRYRRLERPSPEIQEEYLIFCPTELRLAFPEENNRSLRKIPKLEDPAHRSRPGLVPRRVDLDMNQHVNNVTYIGWVLESMPQEVINTHELRSITLDYRRECQHGDIVDSLTTAELDAGIETIPAVNGTKDDSDSRQFLHLLRLSGNNAEINRGRTEWRKKPLRR